jgi:hypothetical protein
MPMTNAQAQEAAKAWHGQAGGRMVPQLTENELAGLVNEALANSQKGVADEYDRLIRHMDAGGDFFEFQVAETRRRNGEI